MDKERSLLGAIDSILEDDSPSMYHDTNRMLDENGDKLVELHIKSSTNISHLNSLREQINQRIETLKKKEELENDGNH